MDLSLRWDDIMIFMRKVLIFGTFDGVHEGHRAFFRQAKKHGDYVVAAVARDEIIKKLKNHDPAKTEAERIAELELEEFIDEAVLGDSELGTYGVILEHRPDVIALGYDQGELEKDLKKNLDKFDWPLAIIKAGPHRPDRYHSSLLRSDKNKRANT
ncbi:MAG: adenylyltransferase/cytidyltransferase family protein [Candidatus Liptonbacteria bacterium]|nr:adenylyltransferase/cytidyltransferase family protein [Candidatus Liptonbacteria bacterium]